MIKMVVFDLDGTLVNSLTDLAESVNKGLKKAGLMQQPIENFNSYVGNGREMLIKRAMQEHCNDEEKLCIVRDTFNNEYAIHCNDNTQSYDGCNKMLSELLKNDIKICVLSNKPDEFVDKILKKVYPTITFTQSWGKKQQYNPKPDAQSLLAMIDMYNLDKNEVLYVGDSDVDVFTAKNAQLKMIGVEWGFRGREELLSAGADYVVGNADELLECVLNNE